MKPVVGRWLLWISIVMFLFVGAAQAADLNRLFKKVEKLKLERQGYVLGAKLNKQQLEIAAANPEEAKAEDTFKFKDDSLFIVAHKETNRVLVIYELFEKAAQKKVQDLVGDLYVNFEEPTVMAHDKIVYWAWVKKGKVSSKAFDKAKEKGKKLDILATVKCVSDIKIMEKQKEPLNGDVYYIISSDAILKFFAGQDT